MTANTTQRVDAERLPSPHWARDLHGETEVFTTEEVAALLQQLAELKESRDAYRHDAEALLQINKGAVSALEAAERAREAAIAMCKRIVNFSDCEMGDGDTARSEAAAFLAANGGGK